MGYSQLSVSWLCKSDLIFFLFFCVPQLFLWGAPFWVRLVRMWPFLNPQNWGIPSSWIVHAGCLFAAGIHSARTWMSGSFESARWNAYVHRLDLGLYSHPKEFWGNGVRTRVNSKGKIRSTGNIPFKGVSNPGRCIKRDSEPNTLQTELLRPSNGKNSISSRTDHWHRYQEQLNCLQTRPAINYRVVKYTLIIFFKVN